MSIGLVTVYQLRNKTTAEIVGALIRDGFTQSRRSRGSNRAYTHQDGRKVFVHYHKPNDPIPRGTLGNIIDSAKWTEDDAKRLKLI